MVLGIDLARYQNPFALPYAAWLADGLEVVIIQITHGTRPEPVADEHLLVAIQAHVPHIAAYHWLTAESGRQQALNFKSELKPRHQFVVIDVEQEGVTAQHLLDFLAELEPGFNLTILLYGNNLLAAIVAAHPELKRFGVWYAAYPTFPLPCSTPPALLPHNVPASIVQQMKSWQYAGDNGVWPPFKAPIDRSIWYSVPGETMPDTLNRGCLMVGHTQGNSPITPIYRAIQAKAKAQGKVARLKGGISDEDGGKVIEWKEMGVETRINRKHLPEEGPNHWMEGGGDANVPLTPQQKRDFIDHSKRLPYKASPTEFNDSSGFQVMGNEWERNTAQGWVDYLDLCMQVIIEGDQMSIHDKAILMGVSDEIAATLKPVNYCVPVFNAGSPRANIDTATAMYDAIADHPIWPLAEKRGDFLFCHEGITFDAPFTDGEGQPIEPGAYVPPGAGTMNFRIFNLLDRLWKKGIHVKWGVGEWYDGRRPRGYQIALRVANMIRHDTMLSASPFSRDCIFYAQFQFDGDPGSRWYPQDCSLLWSTDEWQQHLIDVSERINGANGDEMYYTDSQVKAIQADLAQAQVILAGGHVWKVNDVALAIISPLVTYVAPNGLAHDLRPPFPGGPIITYDLHVIGVSPDGLWLEVAANLWVRTVDVKPKA